MHMQPPNNNFQVLLTFIDFIINQRSHFTLLLLSSFNFNNFNNFVTLASTRLRLPEDDADALKHVGLLTIYKILLICTVYAVHLLVGIIKTHVRNL
jgi:hypothetical protein